MIHHNVVAEAERLGIGYKLVDIYSGQHRYTLIYIPNPFFLLSVLFFKMILNLVEPPFAKSVSGYVDIDAPYPVQKRCVLGTCLI